MLTDKQVRDLYNAFNTGDLEVVLERIHPNAEWLVHGTPNLVMTIHCHGLDKVFQHFELTAKLIEVRVNEPTLIYRTTSDSNKIMVSGRAVGMVYETKKVHDVPFADTITIDEDQKIIKFERLLDTLALWESFQK